MPRVYLSGPINGSTYNDATNWRLYIQHSLARHGVDAFSPMRGKEFLREIEGPLHDDRVQQRKAIITQKGLVNRDRNDVMHCDVVLAHFPPNTALVSIGTVIELGWADAFRKPIVVWTEGLAIHDHPFIRELATYIVPTSEEAMELVLHILLP